MRWIALLLCSAALAQDPRETLAPARDLHEAPAQAPREIEIRGRDLWVDTGIDLRAGDAIAITATGTLEAGGQKVAPKGGRRGWLDMIRSYPVNEAGPWALIGRLGETGRGFLVGESLEWQAPRAGRLFLGINKTDTRAVSGSYVATIALTRRALETTLTELKLPQITLEMIDRIPRRVRDAAGTPGDNTNFVIVGAEHQILDALHSVGWLEVDRGNEDAVMAGIQAVLNREAYLKVPMSELLLFDRPQDYGMALADPLMVIAERHHFRLWRAPFDADGHEVWVGAGTHDIGFDRDQRNGALTHRIDPEVDKERDFIGKTLEESGKVAKMEYVLPSQPSTEAKTAHGQEYRSDGRVLVIYLTPEPVIDSAIESVFFLEAN